MCREQNPLLLAEDVEDALRLFYGGMPPSEEPSPNQTTPPQNDEHDAERAELVA